MGRPRTKSTREPSDQEDAEEGLALPIASSAAAEASTLNPIPGG